MKNKESLHAIVMKPDIVDAFRDNDSTDAKELITRHEIVRSKIRQDKKEQLSGTCISTGGCTQPQCAHNSMSHGGLTTRPCHKREYTPAQSVYKTAMHSASLTQQMPESSS